MANKTVIDGSSKVSARQLKELFNQIDSRTINSSHLQDFLDRKNPFSTGLQIFQSDTAVDCSVRSKLSLRGYEVFETNLRHKTLIAEQYRVESWTQLVLPEEVHKLLDSPSVNLLHFWSNQWHSFANAKLLEFFHERPFCIPEKWRGKRIFFLGTTYVHKGENTEKCYVQYLSISLKGSREIGTHCLQDGFKEHDHVLLLKTKN